MSSCSKCQDNGYTLKLDKRERYVARPCPWCPKGMLEIKREAESLGVDVKAIITKAREVSFK